MTTRLRRLAAALLCLAATSLRAEEPAPPPDVSGSAADSVEAWRTLGLMRVRDMTPFGINRLDMLPAHAVKATPGTWAAEITMSYQNTWALSENVKSYLAQRGLERGEIGEREITDIFALPGDAYLVDCEIGVVDLTLHYRASEHFGLYATVPYFVFGDGFLDATIEGFHNGIGISNAGRNYAPRNRFLAVVDLEQQDFLLQGAPGNEFGDPVIGVRYTIDPRPEKTNIVVEAAAKFVVDRSQRLVSSGENDYGVQVSFQRFFARNALYLTLAGVWYAGPDNGLTADLWLPTLIAGWETRLSRHLNFIAQGYLSKSNIQDTELDELSAEKIQATVGLQWLYKGNVLRFGITENIANFDNTPDIGVNLSVARILFR